jgi:predicted RNase H-like HicB family nuclease
MIDRESDGRFIASIPDLDDMAAYGHTDKDAVAHLTELASERVRAAFWYWPKSRNSPRSDDD